MRVVRTFRRSGLVLVIVLALAPAPAAAIWPFSSKSSGPAAPDAPPASSIPAPEVAQRAEDASKVLRDLDALLTPGAGIVAIQTRLPDIVERLRAQSGETTRRLDEMASGAMLDALTNQWQSVRAEVATYVDVLAERATALERSLQRLTGLRETWTQARTDARASRAPAPVLGRIDGILTAIDQMRTRLQQERATTLVLQDRIAQQVAQCDDALARLAAAREGMSGRLLARDGVVVWDREQLAGAVTELPDHVRDAVAGAVAEARRFTYDQRARIVINVVLFAGLALLTYFARRVARGLGPGVEEGVPSFKALERPFAAALLLVLLANGFSASESRIAQALGEMLVLVPTLRVVRVGMDPHRVRVLYSVGALLLADLVRRFASTVPLLEQQIFLLEVLGVMGVLGWRLLQRPRGDTVVAPATAEPDRLSRPAAVAALIAVVAAGVAAAAGYMRLGLFIGAGILGALYVALVLYTGARVIGGLIAVGLRIRPFYEFLIVQRHRPLLERRARQALWGLAITGWTVLLLRHFGLWSSTIALADAVLTAEVRRGALSVSLGGVVVFVVMVAATFVLSSIARFVLAEEIYPRLAPERTLPYAVSTLVHYTVILTGFLLGLAALGVDLTKVTILAGALGVGIGFGLQGLVNNFVSGLVVLYERRINVGDAVQIGEVGGRVQQMGLRACTVRTWEGAEVIVPNASLTSEKVANWTLSDHHRRIDLPVGVAYGTSPEKVADILLGVARKHSHVLAQPAPVVLFRGFGDSALLFEMRVWTNRFEDWMQTHSELAVATYGVLREAGIEIPFPQREVRVRPG
jgi:small-conductance mechanosensitive channel